ncbi:TonB-dependent receptor [Acetobacter nitrogenifigens]|nr:TonB-dependent receptor [Acetobacter nitrogenifigens]
MSLLTCTTGLACAGIVWVGCAEAATSTSKSHKRHVTTPRAATTAPAAAAAVAPAPRRPVHVLAKGSESVNVSVSRHAREVGGGMMRVETSASNVQTVSKQYIDMISPTATILDIAKNTPSMNISVADTSGMQGGNIQSRGLTDSDIGLLLNGAPATSANYLNEDADAENVESVTITPSSSRVEMPITAAAGGVLDETTHTPTDKFGGMVDFSYGTNNMSREFIRLESGEIGHSGVKGYFSFSNTHARSWLGSGINWRKHIDFGMKKTWANGSTNDIFISWNYEDFTIDHKPTAAEFYDLKHNGVNYNKTNTWDPTSDDANRYWKNNIDHWNQLFLSAPQHFVLTKHVSFDLLPYFNLGRGWDGNGATSSRVGGTAGATGYYTSNGTPITDPNTWLTSYYQQYADQKLGVTAKLGVDVDRHNHLTFGYWFEHYTTTYGIPSSYTRTDGSNPSPNTETSQAFTLVDGQLRRVNSYYTNPGYDLHALFIEDVAKYLQDRLVINAGFKYIMTNYWDPYSGVGVSGGSGYSYSGRYGMNLTSPLPHLSISYQFNPHHQIYVNAQGNFRQPSPDALSPNYQGTLPKPQYSISEELGYRYNDDHFIVDLSFFNMNITNRLMSVAVSDTQTSTVNVGNQTTRGVDLMLATHPWHHISPFIGFEYLSARLDSNVPYQNTYLNTKGKQAVGAPHVTTSFGLTYDDGRFFGNFTLKYVGPQSVTLVGDERMPGYITDAISLGYRFKPWRYLKSPTFRLNFSNLTDSRVRSGAYGFGTNNHSTTLMDGTTLAGGNGATYWLVPRFTMTGTISTGF